MIKKVEPLPSLPVTSSKVEATPTSSEGPRKTLTERYLSSLLREPTDDRMNALNDSVGESFKVISDKSDTLKSGTSGYERVETCNEQASSFEPCVNDVKMSEAIWARDKDDGLSLDQYEPVEPIFMAKAQPAIIVEDQVSPICKLFLAPLTFNAL